MGASFIINTYGDALVAVRGFLKDLWAEANLQGMLLPVYQVEKSTAAPRMIEDPGQIEQADPFVPLMTTNAARVVAQIAKQRKDARFGAVLRPCEARALRVNARQGAVDLKNWLTLGVDCLASFPLEDFAWRLKRAGGLEQLSRENLRFARVGGIAPYRYRRACQICPSIGRQNVHLNIGLLGIPTSKFLLVTARKESRARDLNLEAITAGRAPTSLVDQHERSLARLVHRRRLCRDRMACELPALLPRETRGFLALLAGCAPCRSCLEACPIYAGEITPGQNGNGVREEQVNPWLAACVACGMCEQACPNNLPLTAVHARIRRVLVSERVLSGL